jgi:hypothetical protein
VEYIKEEHVEDEVLLREALAAPEHFVNKWNELLSRFYTRLPAERLRELLLSPKRAAVLGGLFIVDEIHDRAHPVLAEVVSLTRHADSGIRAAAYYAITSCAQGGQEAVFVHALRGLLDPDVSCRIAAMSIAARAKAVVLDAVLPILRETDPGLHDGVKGLLGDATIQTSLIRQWARMEPVYRRFAAVVAARDQSHWLMLAWLICTCDDADIRDFALHFTRSRVAWLVKTQEMIERAAKKTTVS